MLAVGRTCVGSRGIRRYPGVAAELVPAGHVNAQRWPIVCCWVPNWLLLLLLLVLELALARRDFVYYWCGLLLLLLLLLRLGQRGLLGGRLLGRIRHLLGEGMAPSAMLLVEQYTAPLDPLPQDPRTNHAGP